jgi:hypothetical protein
MDPTARQIQKFLLILAVLLGLGQVSFTKQTEGALYQPVSVPYDWSHKHLVFSQPGTFEHTLRLAQDVRFWHQWYQRNPHRWLPPDRFPRYFSTELLQRDWGVSLGANATTSDAMFPAKFSFDVNAAPDCVNDFVVFTTSLVGSSSSPSIVAFNELYNGAAGGNGLCGTGGPSVYWSYNTNASGDTTGMTLTSPTLDRDGTKVAFVENSNASGTAVLHILRWHAGEGGTIAAPVSAANTLPAGKPWTDTSDCPATASCIANIPFTGTNPDTLSSPFVDYHDDVLYVGDDNGLLHKFTGVFVGTPAEVTTGGWPITVHSGFKLTGPVFDAASGNIFVGDGNGRLSFVRDTASTVGSCGAGSPPCLGSNSIQLNNSLLNLFSNPIVDPPIVDSSTGKVFAFIGNDGATLGAAAQVAQADTQLSGGSVVTASVGAAGANLHTGAFDNAYLASSAPNIQGHLYVCGKASGLDNPTLYRIGFNSSGVMNSSTDAGSLALANFAALGTGPECSPVTELLNGSDRIFLSVANNGIVADGCTGGLGCVMSVVIPTASPFTFPAAVSSGLPESGGTGGIIIDNVGSGGQESNIYFTPLANSTAGIPCNGASGVGCAVKLTQSAFQ